ncbi:sulfurtransferase [Thaumasiovibrio sp. DFM-14]|uniref:sulfurtransferase n=1 Tax=Thaumasiovibrio sp. DFM-14 TaxID=3384792 RepID=UPI00399FBE50
MPEVEVFSPLVSVEWLATNICDPNLVILDATWYLPGSELEGKAQFEKAHIPGARYFDFDATIMDATSSLPHMMPTVEQFSQQVGDMGICNSKRIVIYDGQGLFSAPRVWWMFKAMGHRDVAVLDGGLPAWIDAGGETAHGVEGNIVSSCIYQAQLQATWIIDAEELNRTKENPHTVILDARSSERFYGRAPEPRRGVRRGHIPYSKNLPFVQLVKDGHFLSEDKLALRFKAVADREERLIFTCGSGVTACILALGAYIAGYRQLSVFDGSWVQWGGDPRFPVSFPK